MADEPRTPSSPKDVSQATATEATQPTQEATLDVPASERPSLSSGDNTNEKGTAHTATTLDLDRIGETEGYVLDEDRLREKFGIAPGVPLKKSKDGVVLIPQPTDDPEDPLNWSRLKKAAILLVIGLSAATSDYSAATGASALLPQAEYWRISPNEINHATAGMVAHTLALFLLTLTN